MSWLDPLLALKTQQAGTTAGTRQTINFASGATVVDDPANDRVNVTITDTGITQLTGDVTAGPGSGSIAATVAKVNGVSVSGTPSSGQVIRATSGTASSWANVARGDITNTSGATGDIITGDATTLGRLAIGSTGQVLTVSGGAPVWSNPGQSVRTTYELDFGTVAAETIPNGATRAYNGVTWGFINTGGGSIVTSASGLTFNAVSGNYCAAYVDVSSLSILDFIAGNWRVWWYNSAFTVTSANNLGFGVYNQTGNAGALNIANNRQYDTGIGANYYGTCGPDASGNAVQKSAAGLINTQNVIIIECVDGHFVTRSGVWSAGWPSLASCLVHSIGHPNAANLGVAGVNFSTTRFFTDCAASGARTNTIKNFKVEVW